ncbi:MAG: hypothetical protein KGJ81_15880, partial [Alphaproteobacteria bacterium]|nr:hypothetical protein [Alphaproteobacteria bacterium]
EGMKRGEIKIYDDINLKPDWDADKRHWEKFNLPANFLKHSDRDATKLLDESELQNRELLVAACAAYKEVMGVWTPEMLVFGQFWLAESCDPPGFVPNEICAKLREVDPSLLYETCLGMIQDMKGEGRGEN